MEKQKKQLAVAFMVVLVAVVVVSVIGIIAMSKIKELTFGSYFKMAG